MANRSRITYHVDVMRKYARSLEVSQRVCGIFWFVVCQETVIQEDIVSSYCQLVGMLLVYSAYYVELSACKHHVVAPFVLYIEHLFVRFNIPVVIVFILDRGLVKDLSRADVIVTAETA